MDLIGDLGDMWASYPMTGNSCGHADNSHTSCPQCEAKSGGCHSEMISEPSMASSKSDGPGRRAGCECWYYDDHFDIRG